MKNTLTSLLKPSIIALVWGIVITALAVIFFRYRGTSPQFPYYYDLLLYVKDPAYAVWGFFDGVHYLRLISAGYVDNGTQAFFPIYPFLVHYFSQFFHLSYYLGAVFVSLLSLIISLRLIWELFPKSKKTLPSHCFFFQPVFSC